MGSEVVWSFSGIKWLPEPPEGDRRQREQALKVTSTCRCWRPRHRGRQAGLGAVTVTGSNTKANKVLRGKGCPVVCRNSARSLTAFLDHLNPRHVTRGLLCPVNSMQMFHDSATTEQGVAGTYFTSRDRRRGKAGSTGDASFPAELLRSQRSPAPSRWPLPRDRARVLQPLCSLQKHSSSHSRHSRYYASRHADISKDAPPKPSSGAGSSHSQGQVQLRKQYSSPSLLSYEVRGWARKEALPKGQ